MLKVTTPTTPLPSPPSPPPTIVPEPTKQPDNPWETPTTPEKIKCPKCGIVLDILYTCVKDNCPTFLKIKY